MSVMPIEKYKAFQPIVLPNRGWPERTIAKAPVWCSVDLRDGNQALVEPMDPARKRRMFDYLVKMGFKEIEVGFPSASQAEFDFIRHLIEGDVVPADVALQVMTPARDHLIERTFESLKGAKRAIMHLYNSTSTLQRRVVFGMDRQGILDLTVKAAERIRDLTPSLVGTDVTYEYSPESFTGTEMEFAKDVCEAVMEVWQAAPDNKVILNLPATVEMSTPNIYADQIEWFHRNIKNRDSVVISLHPHNDRGTGVAAAELGVMAGADRVEGTLFGNGERTGNVDIVTMALNLFTQGVDPILDISNIDEMRETAEHCTQLPIHPRHPYVGELVYTAFSGSHQDAIKKGMAAMVRSNSGMWEVPYLPIDPQDVGRDYDAVIRINSQSGKSGVAYLLESEHGLELPRALQVDFTKKIQKIAEGNGKEITPEKIWRRFQKTYLETTVPFEFIDYRSVPARHASEKRLLTSVIHESGKKREISGSGSGPIDAFIDALERNYDISLSVLDFHEHSIDGGAFALAAAYVEVETDSGQVLWGVGIHPNSVTAPLRAVVSAVNQIG